MFVDVKKFKIINIIKNYNKRNVKKRFQMLEQLNCTLEEENKALMEQVTKLVSQVCYLLTKCLVFYCKSMNLICSCTYSQYFDRTSCKGNCLN